MRRGDICDPILMSNKGNFSENVLMPNVSYTRNTQKNVAINNAQTASLTNRLFLSERENVYYLNNTLPRSEIQRSFNENDQISRILNMINNIPKQQRGLIYILKQKIEEGRENEVNEILNNVPEIANMILNKNKASVDVKGLSMLRPTKNNAFLLELTDDLQQQIEKNKRNKILFSLSQPSSSAVPSIDSYADDDDSEVE